MKVNYIIAAAGGNNTAIKIIEKPLSRKEYEEIGSKIMTQTERRGVEQVGFLIPSINHFEMGGGEFCGNAARSAAFLLAQILKESEFSFTMSGFSGEVKAVVKINEDNLSKAVVSCYFNGLKAKVEEKEVGSKKVSVVDLGGIVHCLLYESFPKDSYREEHRDIITELNLTDRSAVGVLWLSEVENGLRMDPVVWVKSIDTFFYETSCGSGSIATAVGTGATSVIQPSGQAIKVEVEENGVNLTSEMEEVISYDDFSFVTIRNSDPRIEKLFQGFSNVYIKSFAEAPYLETYSENDTSDIWVKHLENGVIILVLSGDDVIGLGSALPLIKSGSPLDFIQGLNQKPFDVNKAIYMSELAVDSKYRNFGLGSELVKKRQKWARSVGYEYFVMRTASVGSNSFNIYKRIGVDEISEKHNVEGKENEVASASTERVYLYGKL